MIAATAAAVIAVFLVAFRVCRVVPASTDALTISRGALAALRNPDLDDAARETVARQASLRLLRAFVSILVRGGLALAASLLPIWIADIAGIAPSEGVIAFLSRWDVILVASTAIVLGYLVWGRLTARQ
jgi:hypothetical protein